MSEISSATDRLVNEAFIVIFYDLVVRCKHFYGDERQRRQTNKLC